MSSGGSQPGGIDEATLLAFAEGVMPVEQASALRDELAGGSPNQQRLLRRLDAMRRDRAGLASLVACPMPSGMIEAAMQRAQQEALSGLKLAGEREEDIPVSRVVPLRLSRWTTARWTTARWTTARWTTARRLTAAAAIVGVVGGVGLVSMWPKTAPRTTTDSGSTITIGTSNTPGQGDKANRVTSTGSDASEESTNDPNAPTPVVPLGANALLASTDPNTASGEPAAVVPFAAAQPSSADRASRILELAKAGRLVIKVTARTPRQCEQQFAALAAKPQGSRPWDVSADAPGQLVASLAALSPKPTSSPDQAPGTPTPSQLVAGSSPSTTPMIVRQEVPLPIVVPPGAQDIVGLVHVAPTLEGIESIKRALTDAVGFVTVAELPEALAGMGVNASMSGAVTIDSALWWAGPPTRWATWASVPVIVER